jgi:hypothetical protein
MVRAAIYARMSTDKQSDTSPEVAEVPGFERPGEVQRD